MDVFGPAWENYVERIREGFSLLKPDDVTVLCGDLSWGMSLESAAEDFRFVDSLPGRKYILKGNHDYWWSTARKMHEMFEQQGITTIDVLQNNCFFYGEKALCGTRGWFYEEETHGDAHDKKIMARELIRLELSLKAAGDAEEKICFLHYPPLYGSYMCRDIIALLKAYGVRRVYYGHIHGYGFRLAKTGLIDGIEYNMVSADYLGFRPKAIL